MGNSSELFGQLAAIVISSVKEIQKFRAGLGFGLPRAHQNECRFGDRPAFSAKPVGQQLGEPRRLRPISMSSCFAGRRVFDIADCPWQSNGNTADSSER
jgi:hypothetical protein